MTSALRLVKVNSRVLKFSSHPRQPIAVICFDGLDPSYIQYAERKGAIPTISSMIKKGFYSEVNCSMPSFTNPNNISIITGEPTRVHGICGNFFFDSQTNSEVMMNDAKYLRAENTILSSFYAAQAKVGAITAKNKLLSLLSYKLRFDRGESHHPICFSVEGAKDVSFEKNGVENLVKHLGSPPDIYSAESSVYVLRGGVFFQNDAKLRRDILYLSTTDYVFHKYGPEEKESLEYLSEMDKQIKELLRSECLVGITADHGMNAKEKGVIYLEEVVPRSSTVILPITDPYVKHHASLGSYATVYLSEQEKKNIRNVTETLLKTEGIDAVFSREKAANIFELPSDRIGDLVIISKKQYVLGTARSKHDLSVLTRPLRSHGGLTEQKVPFILSSPLKAELRPRVNYDIFEYCLNNI